MDNDFTISSEVTNDDLSEESLDTSVNLSLPDSFLQQQGFKENFSKRGHAETTKKLIQQIVCGQFFC